MLKKAFDREMKVKLVLALQWLASPLEFEGHGFLENQVFLPTEQAGTTIC